MIQRGDSDNNRTCDKAMWIEIDAQIRFCYSLNRQIEQLAKTSATRFQWIIVVVVIWEKLVAIIRSFLPAHSRPGTTTILVVALFIQLQPSTFIQFAERVTFEHVWLSALQISIFAAECLPLSQTKLWPSSESAENWKTWNEILPPSVQLALQATTCITGRQDFRYIGCHLLNSKPNITPPTGYHHRPTWQSIHWWCILPGHSLPNGLPVQATQGALHNAHLSSGKLGARQTIIIFTIFFLTEYLAKR